MLVDIKTKIRSLIEDFGTEQAEIFVYKNTSSFYLCGHNISSISTVSLNGELLGSGDYDFNSSTNELTITASLASQDKILVKYDYYKYSDTELNQYIRSALVYLSIYGYCSDEDFELGEDEIEPTPTNKEEDLIALVASILIKPDYKSYRLGDLSITYNQVLSREQRIEKLVENFRTGDGIIDVVDYDNYGRDLWAI